MPPKPTNGSVLCGGSYGVCVFPRLPPVTKLLQHPFCVRIAAVGAIGLSQVHGNFLRIKVVRLTLPNHTPHQRARKLTGGYGGLSVHEYVDHAFGELMGPGKGGGVVHER